MVYLRCIVYVDLSSAFCFAEDYERAKALEVLAEETSNLDESGCGKERRNKKRSRLISESNSGALID